ncbi:glycosyltransferase [Candidatus Roizmanbacteria bacterium]|nr:glycosyltransferase [Candidatus Roizmanbacteria bacterium]
MKNSVFFSIVIPTLNEVSYLPKILSDLTQQRQKNFEAIIVDASSEDKTREKALTFSKKFPLEVYSVKKRNVSYQRNYGANKAKGEYFVFLDADARINTNFTKNLYNNIFKKKGFLFLPTLTTEEQSRKNKVLFKLINFVIELSQSLNKPLSAGGGIFIKRWLFLKINGFSENLYISEDHNLVQKARKAGAKAEILKDVEVVFNMRRIKKEGEATVLYKYLLATAYMLTNGEIKDKIFMYEMGGDRYKEQSLDKRGTNIKEETLKLRELFRKTSAFFKDPMS